jgi:hypothetical protein
VGVGALAVEDPIEVAVGNPGARGPNEDTEDYVEDQVGRGVAYGEAREGADNLYALPAGGPHETPMTGPVITACLGVLKNSPSPRRGI